MTSTWFSIMIYIDTQLALYIEIYSSCILFIQETIFFLLINII